MALSLSIREEAISACSDSWLAELRLRYDRLLASRPRGEEAVALVKLAVKLSELTDLAHAGMICPRDAGLLPLLARHVQTQLNALEGVRAAHLSRAPGAPRRAA